MVGVFIPIANNGWLISTTSPQFKPSFDLTIATVISGQSGMAWISRCR